MSDNYLRSKTDKELVDGIELLNGFVDDWLGRICKRLKIEYTPEFKEEMLGMISKSSQLKDHHIEKTRRELDTSMKKMNYIELSEQIQNV